MFHNKYKNNYESIRKNHGRINTMIQLLRVLTLDYDDGLIFTLYTLSYMYLFIIKQER